MALWQAIRQRLELFRRGIFREPASFPPYNDGFQFFCFVREPFENTIALLLPTGDSYDLEPRILERYLKQYGLPEDCIMGLMSYIWNFYNVWYDRETELYQSLPKEELVDENTGRISIPAFLQDHYRRAGGGAYWRQDGRQGAFAETRG